MHVRPLLHNQPDFTGMKAGDWFLFCDTCRWQSGVGSASASICHNCGKRLYVCTVDVSDVGGITSQPSPT